MGVMKGLKVGSPREKFDNAFGIAVWRLTDGVKGGGKGNWRLKSEKLEEGILELSNIGIKIQNEKQTDRAAVAKIKAFNRLTKELRKEIER